MGLDMYLTGKKFLPSHDRMEDGFRISEVSLEIGCWWKHPNLHGFIVQTFAGGKDDCTEIDLSVDDLQKILDASEADQLPATEGFFFGVSRPEDKAETKKILTAAIEWLKNTKKDKNGTTPWKSVEYRASW
jgi:hypothetical protein